VISFSFSDWQTARFISEIIAGCQTGDWVGFNVPLNTLYRSVRGRFLRVKRPNQQCQSTEGSSSPKDRLQSHLVHLTMLQTYACIQYAVIHNIQINLSTVKWAQWDKTQSRELLGLSHVCALHCAQLLHTILHRTDLIIFPHTLHTITIAPMMSTWRKGALVGKDYLPITASSGLTVAASHGQWVQHQRVTPADIVPCLLLTYCKTFFKLTYVSPVAPPIITIKGVEPNFMTKWGKFDNCCGRNLEISSSVYKWYTKFINHVFHWPLMQALIYVTQSCQIWSS